MLVSEFLLIGTLGGLIGLLITRSVGAGIIVGAAVAIAVDVIGWLLAVRATIRLTRAVEVGPEQAPVLHNVIDGLCIATGLPKPKVYIVDDPLPTRSRSDARRRTPASRSRAGCSTSCRGASSKACSRTSSRTSATATCRSRRSRSPPSASSSWSPTSRPGRRSSPTGATTTAAARRSSRSHWSPARWRSAPSCCRSRSRVTARSSPTRARSRSSRPTGLRRALEKLEADHTVVHHVSRATAHMWIESPLQTDGDKRHAKLNRMFDTHPPIAERIAVLRKLEGLDPDERGPVDQTITGVPVDLEQLGESAARRAQPLPSMQAIQPADTAGAQSAALAAASTTPGWVSRDTVAGRQAARLVPRRRADPALLARRFVDDVVRDLERQALGADSRRPDHARADRQPRRCGKHRRGCSADADLAADDFDNGRATEHVVLVRAVATRGDRA